MSISIRTNTSSIIAQSSLTNSTNKLNQTIERMSTGAKLNHASDNAANYSISTNLTTRINAYQVAEDNVNMGLDMILTTSEALSQIETNLVKLRNLAVQAQNGTYATKSLSALNAEATSLLNEITRINESATYNGIKLFSTGKIDVTNTAKELKLNEQGFLQEVTKVDTSRMTKLSSVDSNANLVVGEYSISTADELAQLAAMTNAGLVEAGSTFTLTDDIDLSGYAKWTPIGNSTHCFEGTFNGNGYTIKNLNISGLGSWVPAGLFAEAKNSQFMNLKLDNANIDAMPAGVLVGKADDSKFKNCTVTKSIIKGSWYTGGIMGDGSKSSVFEYCYVNANITGYRNVGGIGGRGGASYYGCVFDGVISASSCAGIAGDSSLVDSCASYGSIISKQEAGGIATHGSVKNSYSNADIKSEKVAGGIMTRAHTTTYFENNIFDGIISGTQEYGLLIAEDTNVLCTYSVKNCYYNSNGNDAVQIVGNGSAGDSHDIFIPTEYSLQVGVNSDSTSSSMACTTFINFSGLNRVLSLGLEQQETLGKIDDMINISSLKQTELGTMQQRMYGVLDEISTQYENLVSTRSTLKDADMGELSSEYIKMQILQNASATLLSTANQTPALALQLL